MGSTLGSLAKHREPKNPRSKNAKILAGAAATAGDAGLTGPMDKAEGKAGAEDEESADEGASSAVASGPILGAHPTIIWPDAHLEGENMLEVALSV